MGEGEEAGVEVGIVAEFAFLKLVEVGGVFFVGEVVAGDVVGLEGEGLGEVVGPRFFRLVGDGEHEVEVAGGDFCFAKEGEGFGGGLGGVVAAEGGELVGLEGLDAEGDAGDSEFAEELGFGEVEGGGVGFEVDFFEGGEVEDFAEAGEEVGEVFFGKEGGGAAAEVDGAEGALQFFAVVAGFGEEGVDEGGEVGVAGGVFVEGAVGADLVTEGEVEVEAERGGHGLV